VREIVLTGIETASYGRDFSERYGLADLICELDSRASCERIRLGSLAPELIDEDFVARVKDKRILAPHFHLSIQSGSSSVLRRMKRRYNAERAMQVIKNIRANIPGATFTTDLMVGFPGETEEEFCQTLDFVKNAGFLDAHVFAYSKREGTPAAYYENQVDEQIKKERSARLIAAKNVTRDAILDKIVANGEELFAIAESQNSARFYTGHTASFVEVKFFSDNKNLSGEVVKLVPVSHKCGVVLCEMK
jgi:threonylcarbamoyladenosine tRNA methylthiotransferase MtaB